MLTLNGNAIMYHDGVPYATVEYHGDEVVLNVTSNPLQPSELLDLIDILKEIEIKNNPSE